MGKLAKLPLASIRENKVALRSVNKESEEYLGLVDSIREKGFFGAITVRERTDTETGQSFYELIDGLHRFSASRDAGLTEINCDITDYDDDAVLETQIMANVHKVETKPIQYTEQLKRILMRNPNMSESELAQKLGKSFQWIQDRLSLNKIDNPNIKKLIDEGRICLANAYALAKLSEEEQLNFLDRAMTEAPDQFVPAVQKRVKEIKEAARKGKDAAPAEFVPVAHMQKMRDVKEEAENASRIVGLLNKHSVSDPIEIVKMTLLWVLHLDPDSVDEQKRKDDIRKREREEAKKKRDAERAAKKLEEAQKKANEAGKLAAEAAVEAAEA